MEKWKNIYKNQESNYVGSSKQLYYMLKFNYRNKTFMHLYSYLSILEKKT